MDLEKLSRLNLDTLRTQHALAAARLKTALLDGTSWEELRDIRRDLTELEIALHRKLGGGPATDPSGHPKREG
ncbi:hypothetical protein EPD60_07725 [Flaviaesturariibacter flavus]|uniref:Uncharacterized protein n=1 Tax=Flaviaesturariibacter flavus TaxID=2502780 RepID=A0A4R1BFB4_9BACT|nr:hypothetical protein [Flaviaesturariibacter flavus]TCJ15840.1 hypothetical protein EPD60_07725 [Flaviaesturariibacter flavus]